MILVLGLGNPGKEHMHNRHNIGFTTLDAFALREGLSFEKKEIFESDITQFGEIILAKPLTYMNASGKAARLLKKQSDAPLVVIYDDITINVGEVKCSFGRGDGGHNGLTSLIAELGTKEFFRIRVGIRPVHDALLPRIAPPNGFETFMLTSFAPFEMEFRDKAITRVIEIIEQLPHKTFEELMNQFN